MRRIVIMSVLHHRVIMIILENMNVAALHENMTRICIGVTMTAGILAGIMREKQQEATPLALPLLYHVDTNMHLHITQDEL